MLIGSAPGVLTSSLNNAWAPVVYRTDAEHRGEVLERTGRDIGLSPPWQRASWPLWRRPCCASRHRPPTTPVDDPRRGCRGSGHDPVRALPCNVHLVFASGRSAGLALVTPTALLLGVTVAWVAGSTLGLIAISVGMTVTYAALAVGVALLARRASPTRWHESRLASPIALGVTLCAFGGWLPPDGAGLVVRLTMSVGTAIAGVVVLHRVWRR